MVTLTATKTDEITVSVSNLVYRGVGLTPRISGANASSYSQERFILFDSALNTGPAPRNRYYYDCYSRQSYAGRYYDLTSAKSNSFYGSMTSGNILIVNSLDDTFLSEKFQIGFIYGFEPLEFKLQGPLGFAYEIRARLDLPGINDVFALANTLAQRRQFLFNNNGCFFYYTTGGDWRVCVTAQSGFSCFEALPAVEMSLNLSTPTAQKGATLYTLQTGNDVKRGLFVWQPAPLNAPQNYTKYDVALSDAADNALFQASMLSNLFIFSNTENFISINNSANLTTFLIAPDFSAYVKINVAVPVASYAFNVCFVDIDGVFYVYLFNFASGQYELWVSEIRQELKLRKYPVFKVSNPVLKIRGGYNAF
jgi:hypothetical protein